MRSSSAVGLARPSRIALVLLTLALACLLLPVVASATLLEPEVTVDRTANAAGWYTTLPTITMLPPAGSDSTTKVYYK